MFEKLLFEICLEIEIWGLKFLVLYTRTMRNYLRFLEAIPRQKVRSYVLLSRLPLSPYGDRSTCMPKAHR